MSAFTNSNPRSYPPHSLAEIIGLECHRRPSASGWAILGIEPGGIIETVIEPEEMQVAE